MPVLDRPRWQSLAFCAGLNPDMFFPERGEAVKEAKAVCRGCPVRSDCLEFALASSEKFGIWGGMSERERRMERRARRRRTTTMPELDAKYKRCGNDADDNDNDNDLDVNLASLTDDDTDDLFDDDDPDDFAVAETIEPVTLPTTTDDSNEDEDDFEDDDDGYDDDYEHEHDGNEGDYDSGHELLEAIHQVTPVASYRYDATTDRRAFRRR
jgi:WhiB family transcriptional regulator, redox-sensing transcriptional regulator